MMTWSGRWMQLTGCHAVLFLGGDHYRKKNNKCALWRGIHIPFIIQNGVVLLKSSS